MNTSNWQNWIPSIKNSKFDTLVSIKQDMGGDAGVDFTVYLFENPSSPLRLSGATSLFDHDCLHVMLRRGLLSQDEAFVVGFSMGTDLKTRPWHVSVFKFLARNIYPSIYKFSDLELKVFDLGFEYAQKLKAKGFYNIHKFNFEANLSKTIHDLDLALGISEQDLDEYRAKEKILVPNTFVSNRLHKLVA